MTKKWSQKRRERGAVDKDRNKFHSPSFDKQDNKSRSVRHEKRMAGALGARTQPNSGALPGITQKGDLVDDDFVYQLKLTKGKRFSLPPEEIHSVTRQAKLQGKLPALQITMEGLPDPLPRDWVAVPLHVWKELVGDE